MSLFEVTAYDRQIYQRELKPFLPEQIIDCHTHVWKRSIRGEDSATKNNKRTVSWPAMVAGEDPVEDLQETYRLMFPGKKVTSLIFASCHNRNTLQACNEYVSECAGRTGFEALYYSRPEQSAGEIEAQIRRGGFLGLKSYLDLAPSYLPGSEIRIFDFFPHHQLEKLNEMGGIMMLHLPRPGRLKDPVNLGQILEIKRLYPRILLIVAHIGRAYCKTDLGDAFSVLSESSDLLFDFSANCSQYAMQQLLESVDPSRILFGSDLPILRMRMRRIEENGTYINLVPPGRYGDVSQDPHMREVSEEEGQRLTFFMYEELLAFKRASQVKGLSREEINNIFYGNSRRIFDQARRNIYGEAREQ